jgi:hypothetical protein
MMTPDSVAQLVTQAQRGEAGAFAALYEQHAPEIHRYLVRQLLGRGQVAEIMDRTEHDAKKLQARGLAAPRRNLEAGVSPGAKGRVVVA